MNEDKQRKATDVLLDLEKKIELVLGFLRTQDLTIKILSNKINELSAELSKFSTNTPRPSVEAVNVGSTEVNTPKHIHMAASANNLPLDQAPKGFRRTSRPETYAGDNVPLNPPKMPLQIPNNPPKAEVVIPDTALQQKAVKPQQEPKQTSATQQFGVSTINVEQRIVNREGKSVFLADVEVFNIDSGEIFYKGRTNGTGKWRAPLPLGKYRVVIRKREPVTKADLEINQEIVVDGSESPLRLQMMIFK